MPIALSNDGLYGATITGAWLREDGSAMGLNVTADESFNMDGSSDSIQPVTGTAYLNFYDKTGKPKQWEIDAALKILVGLDANTWDNFDAVVQSIAGKSRVYLEKKGPYVNVRVTPTTGGGAKANVDATNAKRNLSMLTRGMTTTPAPVQQPAPAGPRAKLIEELTKMKNAGQDFSAYTGGRKVKDMSDAEVDAALAKIANGPDLTPPADDIPF